MNQDGDIFDCTNTIILSMTMPTDGSRHSWREGSDCEFLLGSELEKSGNCKH